MDKIATESSQMLADIAIIDPGAHRLGAAVGHRRHRRRRAWPIASRPSPSKRAHPIIDAYALQGIELVGRYLARAVDDGERHRGPRRPALAAFYGGVCLGPVNTTAGHAVAYPLGTRHKLAHGIANALIFPHVLAFNPPAAAEKTAEITARLGLDGASEAAVRDAAYGYCRDLGLEMHLSRLGATENHLPLFAREAHRSAG